LSEVDRVLRTLLVFVSALGIAAAVRAQTSATLAGTVFDGSVGVLSDARVAVRQIETGLARQTVTGADGRFVVAALPVGEYDVRVERSRFRPLVRQGVVLAVAETISLTVVMELGTVEEAITVSGAGSTVNTQTPELSFLVGAQAIESLPLNGRNYTDLALLQPGVLPYPSRDGGSVVAHGL
jgi:hypothetical protein